MICGVCGSKTGLRPFVAQERMFGWGGEFAYFECSGCGTLQIAEIPSDLSRYYPPDYYSFNQDEIGAQSPLKVWLKRQRFSFYLGAQNPIGFALHKALRLAMSERYSWYRQAGLRFDSAIADIGCGNGRLLDALSQDGFTNLVGIDPFLESDVARPNGVHLWKKNLADVEETFDFVSLEHVFEHMAEPHATMREIARVLKPGGWALIRIPIAAYAWQKYGVCWYQLDAPRHIFLHTVEGMRHLTRSAGLELKKIVFDSTAEQFVFSEGYKRGYIFLAPETNAMFSDEEKAEFGRRAAQLNRDEQGDQAAFLIAKPR